MDELTGCAGADCHIDVLDAGRSLDNFMDDKIKELDFTGSDEPFYVANLDRLFERHLRWVTNLPRVKPFYAVKCNNRPAVVKVLSTLGTGFDCCTKGEIQLALSLGATPDKIIYAHTTKALSHIRYAFARGVHTMTFDGEEELRKISLCHPKAKLVLRIAVDDSGSLMRFDSKFGAMPGSVCKLLERAVELGLDVIGVSFHVGSGCMDSLMFRKAIADGRRVFDTASSLGIQMSLLDIGGGFSANAGSEGKFEEISRAINEALDELFPPDSGVEIIAEPGRYFVESAFTLVVNVIAKRVDVSHDVDEHSDVEESSTDRQMMYFINDGVYGSMNCLLTDSAHGPVKPRLHRAVQSGEQGYRSIIWGPTCDSLDKVADCEWLPEMFVGDWLIIDNMGAYSVSMWSDFSCFERARIHSVMTAETWRALNLEHSV